ncbi:MAG: hypothetical protein AB1513_02005 [Pseudomonadota bacterium]
MLTIHPNRILLALAGGFFAISASAQDRIMFATGDVHIRDAAGQLRPAVKGAEIRPGDTIVTTPGGYAQAKMQAGFMAVRPDTQVKLDSLPAASSPGAGVSSQVTLLQGAVRVIAAEQQGVGTSKIGTPPVAATMVIQTPNANISLSNSDGEAAITPPKMAGAAPTTISLVNSGVALVKSDIGAAVSVASNMAATITGKTLPEVAPIVALPVLPEVLPKIAPAMTSQLPTAVTAAAATVDVPSVKSLPGGLPAIASTIHAPASLQPATTVSSPALSTRLPSVGAIVPPTPATPPLPVPTIVPAPVAIAPVMMPKPVGAPIIAPTVTPVVVPRTVVAPPPVVTPVVTPPPVVIAPKPIVTPIQTCTTLLVNGVKTTFCK